MKLIVSANGWLGSHWVAHNGADDASAATSGKLVRWFNRFDSGGRFRGVELLILSITTQKQFVRTFG
jgi:hypothetical protein